MFWYSTRAPHRPQIPPRHLGASNTVPPRRQVRRLHLVPHQPHVPCAFLHLLPLYVNLLPPPLHIFQLRAAPPQHLVAVRAEPQLHVPRVLLRDAEPRRAEVPPGELVALAVDAADALKDSMNDLFQDSNRMLQAFGVVVESVEPVAINSYPSPPPPPAHPPPAPPFVPCAADGSDDVCNPFVGASWSSAVASYHFYLYDETPDGTDLRLWEWPRVTPTDGQLARNGVCEDGLPSVYPEIPQGDYYVAFGGADCSLHHVNLSTGLIAGCGRVDLVPCTWGTDCHDCGRSASGAEAGSGENSDRRRAQALPALDDAHELHHLNRTLRAATSWHLPLPWLKALRITDHWDP